MYTTVGSSDSTSSSLLQRLQANEPRAWEKMVALYAPLVYDWIRRAGVPETEAVDIGQEVFLAVVQNVGRFEPQREHASFRGWLRVITTNKIRDHFRGKTRQPQRLLDPATNIAPERPEPPAEDELAGLLPRLLAWLEPQFQPKTWQAFWRTVVEDRLTADVAAELGMQVDAVRQAKARVLRRLRQELAELD